MNCSLSLTEEFCSSYHSALELIENVIINIRVYVKINDVFFKYCIFVLHFFLLTKFLKARLKEEFLVSSEFF